MTAPEQQPTVQDRLRKLFAPVLAVGATLLKFGAIVFKLKVFTVVISMVVSLGAYAWLYGWKFALGFVLLIAVHELGHVLVLRARGIDAGLPVFLPFIGAFVTMKSAPKSVYDESLSGIAGPFFGVAGSFVCLWLGGVYDSDLLRVLAYSGFFLNLFNLLPVLPLDGGLRPPVTSWGVLLNEALNVSVVALYPWLMLPVIPVILLIGGFELYRRFRGRNTEASRTYFALTSQQRWQIASLYVGLIVVILWAMHTFPLPPR